MRGSNVAYNCDYCTKPCVTNRHDYLRKKHHFCSRKCYTEWRRNVAEPEQNNAWKGGTTASSRKAWSARNKEKLAAMKRARRRRELEAPGSHTKEDWERVKAAYNYECVDKDDTCRGSITKDHEIPLTMGGSNDPDNLRPRCRSHNSRKWRKIYATGGV